MASPALLLLIVALLTVVIRQLLKFLKLKSAVDKINGPTWLLTSLGNYLDLLQDPSNLYEQTMGCASLFVQPRIFRMWILWKPFVFIYGPEEAKDLLESNKHLNKGYDYRYLEPWLGRGLLTSKAEKWRPRRKLLTPTFHYDILKDFVDVFNAQAKVMLKKMEKTVGQGPRDYYPFITLCALDIICETAMGEQIRAQSNEASEYVKAVYRIADIVQDRVRKFWTWNDTLFWYIGRGKEHDYCLNILHGFTEQVVNARCADLQKNNNGAVTNGNTKQSANEDPFSTSDTKMELNETSYEEKPILSKGQGKHRLAFLDLLIAMGEKNQLTLEDIKEEVNTFMFEGHDTTSASMNWALHLIGLNPEIQSIVQMEIDTVLGEDNREISFDDIKGFEYLERCIKEALRLFPSVPFLSRAINTEIDINGVKVPEDVVLALLPFLVHRDPIHWPNPEVYDPDRFLPDNSAKRHPFAYIPFSAGSRNCIGQRFALMEEKTILAWIFRHFTVTSTTRRDHVRPKAELILRPTDPIQLELKLRRNLNF